MADVPLQVQQYIDNKYPKPRVDREWLRGCYEWVLGQEGVSAAPPYAEALGLIENQLLESNLSDSMESGSGLPGNVRDFNCTITLPGVPTLVEIVSLTEIGYSAFQLDQVRKAREERIAAGLDEYGEGDDDADLEVEGEGPLPKYPRSMLSLELTDGESILKALEYKPLTELSLVRTPLGFKMQLKKVRIVCGVAHLEPDNVVLLGERTGDREALRQYLFRQDLRRRMGLPIEPAPEGDEADENMGVEPPPASVRSPLRDISPPPSPPLNSRHNDDEDVEPRRRRVPSTSSTLLPNVSRSRVPASSSYFPPGNSDNPSTSSMETMGLSPTLRQTAPTLPSPDLDTPDDFDFEMFDELQGPTLLQPPAASSSRGSTTLTASQGLFTRADTTKPSVFPRVFSSAPSLKGKLQLSPEFKIKPATHSDSDDFYEGMNDDFDSEDLKLIETTEQEALSKVTNQLNTSTTLSTPSSSNDRPPHPRPSREVITILSESDDGDDGMQVEADDKENLPVETRHVRRRVGEGRAAGGERSVRGPETPSRRTRNQRTGSQANRPLILASQPEDVLEISD